jgi:hypothetical protein
MYDPALFEVDGSLRDVYISNVGIPEWDALLLALQGSNWEYALELVPSGSVAERSASDVFRRLASDEDASARLAIRVGSVWFTSHFVDRSEIEFSFDPSEVAGEPEFNSLQEFMNWLARVCKRRVIMTMETTDHRDIPALLEAVP